MKNTQKPYTLEEVQIPASGKVTMSIIPWTPQEFSSVALLFYRYDSRDERILFAGIYWHPSRQPTLTTPPRASITTDTLIRHVIPVMEDFDRCLILWDAMERGWKHEEDVPLCGKDWKI